LSTVGSGDVALVFTPTALVILMTGALSFFYGGMVDNINIINQLFLSIICMGIVII
jgi:ammonia channel protein AmtB